MGKRAPSPPPAPDPVMLAKEQARANRINQVTPFGNVYYGTVAKDADGNPILDENGLPRFAFDPSVSEAFAIQTETPFQREARTRGERAALGLYDNVVDPLVRPGGLQRVDLSGAPAIGSRVDTTGLPAIGGDPRANAPGLVEAIGPEAVTRRIDAGSLPGLRSGLDPSRLSALPGVGDFSADAGRVEDATFRRALDRLAPVFAERERRLEQTLANRGQPLGYRAGGEHTAANAELERLDRARNDAVNQAMFDAIQSGRAEQSRLFGLGLAARQQGGREQLDDAALAREARGQLFGEGAQQAEFANQAANQAFGQALAAGQFRNAAREQAFGENVTAEQLAAAVRNQLYGERANDVRLQNAARQQMLGEQSAIRGQQMNELASLLGGQQFNATPTGTFFTPGQIDVVGPYAMQQQAQLAAFNAGQARNNLLMSSLLRSLPSGHYKFS